MLEYTLRVIDAHTLQKMKVVVRQTFESAKESSKEKVFRSGLVECCVRHDGTRCGRKPSRHEIALIASKKYACDA